MSVDYLEKAMKIDNGDWPEGYEHLVQASTSEASSFALIVIAQELRRLNDNLDSITESNSKYPGLRVWPYGIS